jgi:hypothetical protein
VPSGKHPNEKVIVIESGKTGEVEVEIDFK